MHKLSPHHSLLLFLVFFAVVALVPSSAAAATYALGNDEDIIFNVGHGGIETTYGYSMAVSVTVPSSVPPSTAYSVTTTKSLTGSQFLACYDHEDDSAACNSGNSAMWSYQNGSSFSYAGWGSDTQTSTVVSGASGSDTLSFIMRPAAGSSWGATGIRGGYSYPNVSVGSVLVPISAAPTVQLYFQ